MKKMTVQVPADLHADMKFISFLMNTSMRSMIVEDMESRTKFFRQFADSVRSGSIDDFRTSLVDDMQNRVKFLREFMDTSIEEGRDFVQMFDEYFANKKDYAG